MYTQIPIIVWGFIKENMNDICRLNFSILQIYWMELSLLLKDYFINIHIYSYIYSLSSVTSISIKFKMNHNMSEASFSILISTICQHEFSATENQGFLMFPKSNSGFSSFPWLRLSSSLRVLHTLSYLCL